MQDEVGPEIVARGDPPLSTLTRRSSSRVVKPSPKVSEVRDTFENGTAATRRANGRVVRAVSTETDVEQPEGVKKGRAQGETGKSMILKVLEELKELKDASNQQRDFMRQWEKQQTDREQQLHELIRDLQQDVADTKEELNQVKEQLETATRERRESPFPGSTQASYADIVRNSESDGRNGKTTSGRIQPRSLISESLFCTVDTSKMQSEEGGLFRPGEIRTIVEREVRTALDIPTWRCRAVTSNIRTPYYIRVLCRDEEEHQTIKRVLEANLPPDARVLRDEYHPVRVDGVSRSAILDDMGNILPGLNATLSKENKETEVVKVGWLSDRLLKPYGSMVVYLKNAKDAARFLREGFFIAGGLSGQVRTFERRPKPSQCYNCQEITNHKSYQCKKPQKCGRCAGEGHHHGTCREVIAKCIPCGGPHESFSKHCRMLYPTRHD